MEIQPVLTEHHVTVRLTSGACVWVPYERGVVGSAKSCEGWVRGAIRGLVTGVGESGDFGLADDDIAWCDATGERSGSVANREFDCVRGSKLGGFGGDQCEQFRAAVGGHAQSTLESGQRKLTEGAFGLYSRARHRVNGETHGNGSGVTGQLNNSVCTNKVASGVLPRGPNFERNQAARVRKREKKKRDRVKRESFPKVVVGESLVAEPKRVGFFSTLSGVEQDELRKTRARKLIAQNELQEVRAKRALELEKAKDMTLAKKRQETQLLRDTELNKVSVEEAFAKLSATGNVPGIGGSVRQQNSGTVETVVSDSVPGMVSGSVSPNSSVSMKEVHDMQKRELSLCKDNADLLAKLERFRIHDPALYERLGTDIKRPETLDTSYSVGSDGEPHVSLMDGIAGEVCDDGRFRVYDDEFY